jgi:uncharacterized phage protein (TIGR01671 family)
MTRELKFRAWGDYAKQMFFWSLLDAQSGWVTPDQPISSVMQFTGLKDRNGVEIYEGDILQSDGEGADDIATYSVEYDAPEFTRRYIGSREHTDWDGLITGGLYSHQIKSYGLYVVGNIYENPELVKTSAASVNAN